MQTQKSIFSVYILYSFLFLSAKELKKIDIDKKKGNIFSVPFYFLLSISSCMSMNWRFES